MSIVVIVDFLNSDCSGPPYYLHQVCEIPLITKYSDPFSNSTTEQTLAYVACHGQVLTGRGAVTDR